MIVNGTVSLTGATLRVLAESGSYGSQTGYVVIENDGADAVAGTFGSVTSNLAFLTPTVSYAGGDGNDVVLTMKRNSTDFTTVAATKKQTKVAGALNGLPAGDPLVSHLLGQSADGARQAFDALSGEVHATVGSTACRDSRFTRDAIFSRLQQAYHARSGEGSGLGNTGTIVAAASSHAPMMSLGMGSGRASAEENAPAHVSPLVFWTQAFGSWGEAVDGSGEAASAGRNIGGFLSGVDVYVGEGWRAGLRSARRARTSACLSATRQPKSTAIISQRTRAVRSARFTLRTGASWSWNDIDTERTVVFPGFVDRVEADYDGSYPGSCSERLRFPSTQAGSRWSRSQVSPTFTSRPTDLKKEAISRARPVGRR